MSNRQRLRHQARTARPAGPAQRQPVLSQEDLIGDPALTGTDMPCRLGYLDDPVFGSMHAAIGVSPDGTLITDDTGTEEPLPVAMFEPVKAVMSQNTVTGLVQELLTEAIVACGFHRIPPPGLVWTAQPAHGWELVSEPGQLALRDASGDIWASSQVTPDPRWISAAASRRYVVVFFGPQLGVRTPPGTDLARYTTAARAAEIRAAREQGLVSVALVRWAGKVQAGALGWVPFLPGSFGQHLPGIFAPQAAFTRPGGPAAFGLTSLSEPDPQVTLARGLTARVTRTDIDLIDPAEGQLFDWVGGVRYSEGINADWMRAVRRRRLILLVTGPRLPGGEHDTIEHAPMAEAGKLSGLWAGLLPVILP
jgi:hypothetical protein